MATGEDAHGLVLVERGEHERSTQPGTQHDRAALVMHRLQLVPTTHTGVATRFGCLLAVGILGEWAFRKPAMGGGDMKMMAMVGAFLGPAGAMLTIFLGAVVGTIVFGPVSLKTKKDVPFGVFLALGAVIAFLFGDSIVEGYRTMFLQGS